MEDLRHFEKLISEIIDEYKEERFLRKLLSIVFARIESGYDNPFNVYEIALHLNVSERTFYRRVESIGITYYEIKDEVRKRYGVYLLSLEIYTVSKVSEMLFFKSTSYFIRSFNRWYGCTPKQWQLSRITW